VKRIKGHTVGTKSDRKARNKIHWVVRVNQQGHQLFDEKLRVASVRRGVTLCVPMDVDFLLLENQIGLPMAADVTPLGVVSANEEGIRAMNRKLRTILAALGVIVLIVTGLIPGFIWWNEDLRREMRRERWATQVDAQTRELAAMPYPAMVKDEVIEEFVKRGLDFYYANRGVYDSYLCAIVPPSTYKPIESEGPVCFVNYSINYADETYDSDHLQAAAAKLRLTVKTKEREYFENDDHPYWFYLTHRGVALAAYAALDADKQAQIREKLQKAIHAMEIIYDPKVRSAYDEYHRAYNQWQIIIEQPGKESDAAKSAKVALDAAGAYLDTVTDDSTDVSHWYRWIEFAAYLDKKGGGSLVYEYLHAAKDALAEALKVSK
jgi:hypothetical protein